MASAKRGFEAGDTLLLASRHMSPNVSTSALTVSKSAGTTNVYFSINSKVSLDKRSHSLYSCSNMPSRAVHHACKDSAKNSGDNGNITEHVRAVGAPESGGLPACKGAVVVVYLACLSISRACFVVKRAVFIYFCGFF